MRHFCTYFDSNYLLRGLTLYRSLMATDCTFRLHVVALDEATAAILSGLGLPNLEVVPLAEIEAWAPVLLAAKANRRIIEYYFTLTPQLPLFFFARHPEVELITYVDADLYFYASPEPLFAEIGERSILITPHRYPPHLQGQEVYGLFNVQYQGFRRDAAGLACLERWRDQCLEWCYDRAEDGKYGDQKYLDEWPTLYGDRLTILQHRGGGVAPWNWSGTPITRRGDAVSVGGDPLIFYHFHGVKLFNPWFMSNGLLDWGVMPWRLLRWFYVGYLRQLRATRRWLGDHGVEVAMRDRFLRSGGIGVAAIGEVLRKAWVQATFG
ncbi:MAG: hypothetical protein RIS88_123 [Pseudomonadota bacterium]